MGSLGTVGIILGLPLDIRHITFAAGNLGLALVGNGWQLDAYAVFASVLGIGLIGFVNFIVSFTLSLALAMRSRGIPYSELWPIGRAVWQEHRTAPTRFYFPRGENGPDEPKARVGVEDIPPENKVIDPPGGS